MFDQSGREVSSCVAILFSAGTHGSKPEKLKTMVVASIFKGTLYWVTVAGATEDRPDCALTLVRKGLVEIKLAIYYAPFP
jgi:hypothetical protein